MVCIPTGQTVIQIEQHASPIALSAFPWVAPKYYRRRKSHPTIGATIAVIIHTFSPKGLSHCPFPLTQWFRIQISRPALTIDSYGGWQGWVGPDLCISPPLKDGCPLRIFMLLPSPLWVLEWPTNCLIFSSPYQTQCSTLGHWLLLNISAGMTTTYRIYCQSNINNLLRLRKGTSPHTLADVSLICYFFFKTANQ